VHVRVIETAAEITCGPINAESAVLPPSRPVRLFGKRAEMRYWSKDSGGSWGIGAIGTHRAKTEATATNRTSEKTLGILSGRDVSWGLRTCLCCVQ
jgi:hypothetical protein